MDWMPVIHDLFPLSLGFHCGGQNMVIFQGKNIRALDCNVCTNHKCVENCQKTAPDSNNMNSIVLDSPV